MKWTLTPTLMLILSTLCFGQAPAPHHAVDGCGWTQHKTAGERRLEVNAFLRWMATKPIRLRSANPIRTIPVVFHLLESNPTITDADVENAVASLNNAFSHSHRYPQGQDYSGGNGGVDTKIEFCLAQRAPDGGVTSGIVRWTSDYENFDVDLEDAKLKTQGQWDPRYYLNIWIVARIDSELDATYTGRTWWTRSSIGGYSGGPGGIVGPEAKGDGVVAAGLGTGLLAHEIGHYLDLAHTFSTTCANNDCMVDGDGICDTPPDVSKSGCNQNTCDTDTLSNYSNGHFTTDVPDMTSNFMDYSSCPHDFTQGQADHMLFVIDNYRIELATEAPSNNDACSRPCNDDVRVEFNFNEKYPQPNQPIDFFTTITQGIDQFEWYVEPLGSTGSDYSIAWQKGYVASSAPLSTAANLQHTFTEAGRFRVYLKAWNSANPDCFTSYTRVVRVTCLGIDARFFPDKRIIASKRSKAKLLDSVLFTNRSANAVDFEWTVVHFPYDTTWPAEPVFTTDSTHLQYVFQEPGDYEITLIARNGSCVDTCGPFLLPVEDPTIDGRLKINRVDCYKEDSLRVAFTVFNEGYDTIRLGMPVTFYDEDPRAADPPAKALGTFHLDKLVYGRDQPEDFVAIIPVNKPKLNQIYAVFNDVGGSQPITWPLPDQNVLSPFSEFPITGENELHYGNNFAFKADFQFFAGLSLPSDIPCTDTEIQLSADHENGRRINEIEWTPNANLSCTQCFDPILTRPSTSFTQQVIITSQYLCKDTAQVDVPPPQEVPATAIGQLPEICAGSPTVQLSDYVQGPNLQWYVTADAAVGSPNIPSIDTNTPGTYRFWVSATAGNCESPKKEVLIRIKALPSAPTVDSPPDFCEGQALPERSSFANGSELRWYSSETGGSELSNESLNQPVSAGTSIFWVSQTEHGCESPRASVTYRVQPIPTAPTAAQLPEWCSGTDTLNLADWFTDTTLLWYPGETGGNPSSVAPIVRKDLPGEYSLWISRMIAGCESQRIEQTYQILGSPSAPIVSDIDDICEGDPAPDLAAAVEGTNLRWYNNQEELDGQAQSIASTSLATGTHTYWVSQQPEKCESPKTMIQFTVRPVPEAPEVGSIPTLCKDDPPLHLDDLFYGEALTWYTSAQSDTGEAIAPVVMTDSAASQNYWVSRSAAGCNSPKTRIAIEVLELSIDSLAPIDVLEGNDAALEVNVVTKPMAIPYQLTWLDPRGTIIGEDETAIYIAPEGSGNYTVIAEAEGCIAQRIIPVKLIYQLDPAQLFSPNGDGKNDTWYIGDIDKYPSANLTVFNRWGDVVYRAQSYTNDWQGTWSDGRPLPVATYYYIIDLPDKKLEKVTGSVTIIR